MEGPPMRNIVTRHVVCCWGGGIGGLMSVRISGSARAHWGSAFSQVLQIGLWGQGRCRGVAIGEAHLGTWFVRGAFARSPMGPHDQIND